MEQEKDMINREAYMKVIDPIMNLAIERNKKYGNSFSIVRDSTLVDLVLMKLYRTRKLKEDDVKTYDELADCINYLVFLLMRRGE